MSRLPITKEQRAQVVNRARQKERGRCIRILREHFEHRDPDDRDRCNRIVKDLLLRKDTPSGSDTR